MKRVAIIAALFCGISAAQTPPPQAAGYTLTHIDEFDSLDVGASWTGQTHNWYTSEYGQVITPSSSQMSVAGSVLSLDWRPGMTNPAEASLVSYDMGSKKGVAYRYGYYEARMKWSPVWGAWPGFWLLSLQSGVTNGEWFELDVFEGQGISPSQYFGTVHDWHSVNGSATSNWGPVPNSANLTNNDYSQWHTYGVLWVPGTLTWYFDNQAILTTQAPAIMDSQDAAIILSSIEGPNWSEGNTGGVTSTDLKLNVDWLHVWQYNPVTVGLPNGAVASRGTQPSGDTTPPSVPSGLSDTVSPSGVVLSWNPSSDNVGVSAYDIYRNGQYLHWSFTPSYTDTPPPGVWTYQVLAYDAAHNYSALSAPLRVTTGGDTSPPSVPANLSAVVSPSGISLSWNPSTDNVGVFAYDIYRNGQWLHWSFTPSYFDTPPSGNWNYEVLAYDAAGNYSAQSAPIYVTK